MIDKLAKLWRVSPDIISIKGDNLTVGGSLDLRGTAITATDVKKPSTDFKLKLTASIECKFNLKGFTIADEPLKLIIM